MKKRSSKNIVVVLQNIVTFRASWEYIASHAVNSNLFLITGSLGADNLSKENRAVFSKHIICDEFNFDNIKKACESIFESECCTDLSQVKIVTNDEYFLGLAAQIREAFCIPGISIENTVPFINKIIMKERVAKSNIRIPKVIRFNPGEFMSNPDDYLNFIERELGYPVFAKQIDSAGSEGVAKIINRPQLREWSSNNRSKFNYELDEFITGDLYHIDCLVKHGELIEQLICKYSCPNAEFLDGKALGSIQIRESDDEFELLSQVSSEILAAFECLPDGALHLEVFLTQESEVVFIEVAARAPGGWIPQMHKISRGYNIEEQHFLLQMNEFSELKINTGIYSVWIWFPQKEGMRVKKIEPGVLSSKIKVIWDLDNGVVQKKPASVRDKVCGMILENNDYLKLENDYKTLLKEFNPYE